MTDKPICAGCGGTYSETEYWWNEKTGKLFHSSCAVACSMIQYKKQNHRVGFWWRILDFILSANMKIIKSHIPEKDKKGDEFIRKIVLNNFAVLTLVRTNNIQELNKFYKKVVSQKGIEEKDFWGVIKEMQKEKI